MSWPSQRHLVLLNRIYSTAGQSTAGNWNRLQSENLENFLLLKNMKYEQKLFFDYILCIIYFILDVVNLQYIVKLLFTNTAILA